MKKIVFGIVMLLVGCGYKPLAYYAKEAFGSGVYVEAQINPEYPKAGVNAKDYLNRAILSRLHIDLVDKKQADTVISVRVSKMEFEIIAEDSQGFGSHYRANLDLQFRYHNLRGQEYVIVTNGSSDYASTSTMTSIAIEKAQLDAINLALQQAIDKFIFRVFYQGVTQDDEASS